MKRQKLRSAVMLVSFMLFPLLYVFLSPYVIVDAAINGVINGSFIVFVILFLSSLFWGRSFCGWLCPAGGVQDSCMIVQNKKVRGGNWIKYLIWALWIIVIVFFAVSAGGYRNVDPLYLVSSPIYLEIYFAVLGTIVLMSFAVGKRSMCHHICWMAPFMIIGNRIARFFKWPSLHLTVENTGCKQCNVCDTKCPMSINVSALVKKGAMFHDECILCGSCVDSCPNGVIRFRFFHQDVSSRTSRRCNRQNHEFSRYQ